MKFLYSFLSNIYNNLESIGLNHKDTKNFLSKMMSNYLEYKDYPTFKRKSSEVYAIKYTGDNFERVNNFWPCYKEIYNDALSLECLIIGQPPILKKGEWLVYDSDPLFQISSLYSQLPVRIMTEEEFFNSYE